MSSTLKRCVVLLWVLFCGLSTMAAQQIETAGQAGPVRVVIVGPGARSCAGLPAGTRTEQGTRSWWLSSEPDKGLARQYAQRFHLDPSLFRTDLDNTLKQLHPGRGCWYTRRSLDHRRVIEAAARYGISSMVEKPLSTTMEDALAIRRAARRAPCPCAGEL